jgi:hypothetical protein
VEAGFVMTGTAIDMILFDVSQFNDMYNY